MLRERAQRWLRRPHPGALSRALSRITVAATTPRTDALVATGPAAVWVVGGLSVGGAGKTAVVEHLARAAAAAGRTVAVVGHGYRGATWRAPTRVEAPDCARYGDEASALVRSLGGVAEVWVGPRAATVRAVASRAGVVFVDDAFHDPSCPRNVTVAVVDVTDSCHVLPAGPLREPLSALGRADLVWAHRVDEPGARALAADIRSRVVATEVEHPDGSRSPPGWLAGREVSPVCGIGRPGSFLHTLRALRARLRDPVVRADHHLFRPAELPTGGVVVTTTKDRERLPSGAAVHVLHTRLEVEGRLPW